MCPLLAGRHDICVPALSRRARRLLRRHRPRHLRLRPAGLGFLRGPLGRAGACGVCSLAEKIFDVVISCHSEFSARGSFGLRLRPLRVFLRVLRPPRVPPHAAQRRQVRDGGGRAA